MLDYLRAAALTLAVEVPVYTMGLRALVDVPPARAAVAGVAVNAVTHPLAFLVVTPLLTGAAGPTGTLVAVEIGAWAVETALLAVWLRRDVAVLTALSFVANALSLAAGLAWLRP